MNNTEIKLIITKYLWVILLLLMVTQNAFSQKKETVPMPEDWGNWIRLYELEYKTDLTDRIDKLFNDPPYWTWINAAWETMMMKQGVIPKKDIPKITEGILEMWDGSLEGYNSNKGITKYLEKKYGIEVAGNTNIARTNPPFKQMFVVRYKALKVICLLHDIQEALLDAGDRFKNTIMPGYTHMRHAQPTTLGHYLLSVHDALERSINDVEYSFQYVNANLLGCGALAGTSWPIDRKLVTTYLGMDQEVENANDAVAYVEVYLPMIAGLTNVMGVLSRLSLELEMWSTREYDFVYFDGYGAHSFMMPNKRDNQGLLERQRQGAAILAGLLTEAAVMGMRTPQGDTYEMIGYSEAASTFEELRLGSLKGIAYKNNAAIKALHHTHAYLNTYPKYIESLRANEERMLEMVSEGYSCSTELANELVRSYNIDYRTAHDIVNVFVKESIRKDIPAYKPDLALLESATMELTGSNLGMNEQQLKLLLDPTHFVEVTNSQGGVSSKEVERMVAERRIRLKQARVSHEARVEKMEKGHERLYTDLKNLQDANQK